MMGHHNFTTASLAVAAFLVAGKHLRLLDVDGTDQRRALFIFDDPNGEGTKLETAFVTGGALVPGAEFHRQLRVLRRLIEERLRNAPISRNSQNFGAEGARESKGYQDYGKFNAH